MNQFFKPSRPAALFLLLLFSITAFLSKAKAQDSKGTDFWLMFNSNINTPTLTLFITSSVNTTGVVSGPSFAAIPYSVTANTVTSVPVPVALHTHANNTVDNKGIHVTSLAEVTVYGLNRSPATTDAYLGLPTDILGTDYIVLSYENSIVNGCEMGIVASQNGTTVTITPSAVSGLSTSPFNITMNQGDAYQLMTTASGGDMSGTLVTSDKPIGVYGAANCANIPPFTTYCDHICEMLPPTTAWGKNFVTIPLKTRLNGDTWRMLASQNSTTISVNGTPQTAINKGEFIEMNLPSQSIVTSDKPILVSQYSNGTSFDGVTSDPFMMLVPPYEQFLANYTVTTPATGFGGNYINIAAPNAIVGTMTLDGSAIPASSFTAIGASGFSGAQLTVSLGSHTLNGTLPFGAFIYGFDNADSYGYPGGQSVSPIATISHLLLTPATGSGQINSNQCWDAFVTDQFDSPVVGVRVDFNINGPNTTSDGFAFTNANGVAHFCYSGANGGLDSILASSGSVGDSSVFTWITCQTPTVSISQSQLPGFCQGGTITLTANGTTGVTWSWSTGASTQSINVNANGTYTVTVSKGPGCTASASITINNYNASSMLSSYTIIATDKKIDIHKSSYVQTGGVGSTKNNGDIHVHDNSTITGATTFARAYDIDVQAGSTVTTQILTPAVVTLPMFKTNPYTTGSNVNIANNATVSLNDSIYKNIDIGSNATVTFTRPRVYAKKLQSNSGTTIKFSGCTELILDDKLDLGQNNMFNTDMKGVVVYADKKVDVDKGSTVNAAIYTNDKIDVKGAANARIVMRGMFIGKEVKSEYTTWNWKSTCSGCSFGKTSPSVANRSNQKGMATDKIELNVFPNPTPGDFYIEISSNVISPLKITVYNYLGMEVQNISRPDFTGTASIKVDLTEFASTYYMVKVEMGGQTFFRKVMVAKQ